MHLFDTKVQRIKYTVLREVARHAYDDNLPDSYIDIPKSVAPGPKATMRCCIYKERAIVQERIKLAMGGNKDISNVIEVIPIACDECPISCYQVGVDCRGCIAHRCKAACPVDAISFDEHQKAQIDSSKCRECGKCASVCPYSAIQRHVRPCEKACKVKAISRGEDNVAKINDNKCISCGACVYQCPFGAISDKSFILDAIKLLRGSEDNTKYKTYAIVAPSISSQFQYVKLGQVVSAMKMLGFYSVVEVALGADMVAYTEARELAEKGVLTSSCCPAFVAYIEKNYPKLLGKVSHNLSPMAELARYMKSIDPDCKIVFIGPCTAKKAERQRESVKDLVDCVLTFEELQALIDSRDIDMSSLDEDVLENASYYGRIFARSGGLSDAVRQALKEQNIDFDLKPIVCDGIEECRNALLKLGAGRLPENFVEGMACISGCIGGPGCLTHGVKDKSQVDTYGREALEKSITEAISVTDVPVSKQ